MQNEFIDTSGKVSSFITLSTIGIADLAKERQKILLIAFTYL